MAQHKRQVREEMTEERLEKALLVLEDIAREHGSKFDFLVEQTAHELNDLRQRLAAPRHHAKHPQAKHPQAKRPQAKVA